MGYIFDKKNTINRSGINLGLVSVYTWWTWDDLGFSQIILRSWAFNSLQPSHLALIQWRRKICKKKHQNFHHFQGGHGVFYIKMVIKQPPKISLKLNQLKGYLYVLNQLKTTVSEGLPLEATFQWAFHIAARLPDIEKRRLWPPSKRCCFMGTPRRLT